MRSSQLHSLRRHFCFWKVEQQGWLDILSKQEVFPKRARNSPGETECFREKNVISWTQTSFTFFRGIAPTHNTGQRLVASPRTLENNTASKFKFLNTNEISALELSASQKNHDARGCFYHAFHKPNVCHLGQEPQLKRLHQIWHCFFASPMLPSVADRRLAPAPSENCLKVFFVGPSFAAAAWASGSKQNASAALISASFCVLATVLV